MNTLKSYLSQNQNTLIFKNFENQILLERCYEDNYLVVLVLYTLKYDILERAPIRPKKCGCRRNFLRLSETSRLRGKEFIICSRLQNHKIYGCKWTRCIRQFGALVILVTLVSQYTTKYIGMPSKRILMAKFMIIFKKNLNVDRRLLETL